MEIIIRADASPQIGTGHVMRCLALAQAWLEAGHERVTLLTASLSSAIEARLQAENIQIVHLSALAGSQDDAEKTVAIGERTKASWIVVDGYQFGSDYQQVIKAAGFNLLFVDDYSHATHYWADLVLNQNIYADETIYESREPYTRLLLGTQYALLRKEFWEWKYWQRQVPEVARRVLVTLGGGDSDNVTLRVMQALEQVNMRDLEAVVVVGGSNPHFEELQLAARSSVKRISLRYNVADMLSLMAWADIAIAAGGSTCWELACLGLPSLIITLADNQKNIAKVLQEREISISLGCHTEITPDQIAHVLLSVANSAQLRTQMNKNASKLIDASGSKRVISFLCSS